MELNYDNIINVMLIIYFVVNTIMDVKYREIPISFCVVIAISALLLQITFSTGFTEYIITAAVLILVYFIQALISEGGGDVIMMGVFGFCIGAMGSIISIACSGIYILIYIMYKKIKHKRKIKEEYPVAPFIAAGFATYLIVGYTGLLNHALQAIYNIL